MTTLRTSAAGKVRLGGRFGKWRPNAEPLPQQLSNLPRHGKCNERYNDSLAVMT